MREGKTRHHVLGQVLGRILGRVLAGFGLGVCIAGAVMVAQPWLATPGWSAPPPLEGQFGERFTLHTPSQPAPDATFQDRDGAEVRLPDFDGQVVLVNFWATWCAPCVEEMPTLDALQQDLGGEHFTVMAVSQDVGGRETVEPFLRERLDLDALDIYLDPEGKLGRAFQVRGMPSTYLIDAKGQVVGELVGPADWNAPEVHKLIRHYIKKAAPR